MLAGALGPTDIANYDLYKRIEDRDPIGEVLLGVGVRIPTFGDRIQANNDQLENQHDAVRYHVHVVQLKVRVRRFELLNGHAEYGDRVDRDDGGSEVEDEPESVLGVGDPLARILEPVEVCKKVVQARISDAVHYEQNH